jgi:uncharacterized protein
MWRFDKNWKAQHGEIPWVVRPPSTYIKEHVYFASYPLEKLASSEHARQVLEIVGAETRLLFSGNFPHQEYGDPFDMIADVPEAIRPRVLSANALELYGSRLLAPNR